jgi:diguanylate cyclase (GGDEF)-like protein/PAS domain S-box-containing protein
VIAPDRQAHIRQLFDDYIEMYAARDDRLTGRFSDSFSGYAGSSDILVKDREAWIKVTRQDFAQVPQRVRIEMVDLALQDLSADVVLVNAFFHIHLPMAEEVLSREMARLVLVFRLEGDDWKIVHSGISIPYVQAHDGEVYPLRGLKERNATLEALVQERTQQLQDSQALYRQLTEDTQDVLWKADRNLVITYVSPSDERLRGFKAHEVVGHHVFEMFTPEGVAVVQKLLAAKPEIGSDGTPVGFVKFEVQHRCKDGRLLWAEVLSRPERDAQGNLIGFHGISRETTQRHQMENQIRQLAFYDALTELPNRRLLADRLEQAMASSQRSGLFGAVLFLDLDNFKALNDTHGHAAGDFLLIEVANRLRSGVRAMDTVARMGGDEFVVMCQEFDRDMAASQAQAAAVAEKIRASLALPYRVDVRSADGSVVTVEHRCTASIGIALFLGESLSQDEVCKFADSAMYRAKDAGRNQVQFHTAPE